MKWQIDVSVLGVIINKQKQSDDLLQEADPLLIEPHEYSQETSPNGIELDNENQREVKCLHRFLYNPACATAMSFQLLASETEQAARWIWDF